jgi:hypothetical protein
MANAKSGVRLGFIVYHEDFERLEKFSGDQFKELFWGLYKYSSDGDAIQTDDPAVCFAYDVMSKSLDRAKAEYERRSKNGKENRAKASDQQSTTKRPTDDHSISTTSLGSIGNQERNKKVESRTENDQPPTTARPLHDQSTTNDRPTDDQLLLFLHQKIPDMCDRDFRAIVDYQENGMQDDAIQFAVDTAVRKRKTNFGFVGYLLNEWFLNDVLTADAAREYERKKFVPKEPQSEQTPSKLSERWEPHSYD